jgi:hypothetical protein
MNAPRTGRRAIVAAPIALLAVHLPGCAPEAPPAPAAPEPEPALPLLGSLAALGTVQGVDAQSRQVLVRLAHGGLLDVTPPEDDRRFRALRPGTRVVVEYDSHGAGTIVPAASAAAYARRRRVLATVLEVTRGGQYVRLRSRSGTEQDFEIADRTMMAFATRLRPGDEVAVAIAGP